jgi:thiol-disulfide isomerase/thioredoxin
MAKARIRAGLVASCLLLWGTATLMAAPPTVAQMLTFRPKQEGIAYATPTEQEAATCKVEPVQVQGKIYGWILKDSKDKPLRRFYATNGSNVDIWSYYANGVEIYRELDTNHNGKPDQYRWFNNGGCRWGLDPSEDGKIKSWKQISPEEVSQEILQAVAKRDYARLQALMITDADIKALDLPQGEANRIHELLRKAPSKFQDTCGKVGNISDKVVRWVHLETLAPQCIPLDALGSKQDIVKYQQGSVTYIVEGMKDPFGLLTGEMIQVGSAWRLIDAPVQDLGQGWVEGGANDGPGGNTPPPSPEVQKLLEELRKVDELAPDPSKPSTTPAEVARYNLRRADVLERIADKVKADERDQWLRQMADCLSAAVQNVPTDKAPHQRLVQLRERVVKDYPGSNLAAHVCFCELTAEYAIKLVNPADNITKVQKDYMERLAKFVQDYPKSEDTPDALMQLGMMSELVNDEGPAKKWYELMVKDFGSHGQANKARGAVRRLELDSKEVEMAGATLSGSSFDIKSLKSKVVLVYFWASWNQQCAGDFAKLKTMLTSYGPKGLEVVGVSLDDNQQAARDFVSRNSGPGTELYEQGGMASKLGEQFGIMVLPTMFLVKDGKVVNHNAQMTTVEDELKKLLP